MDSIVITGFAAAIFIGISLGLIGGGGSILTVPVLVYILGVNPVLATAYSLFVVGITKNIGIMVFFALIMLAASYSMITTKKCEDCEEDGPVAFNFPMIALEGSVVGLITGIVGAGGGFLIIPALVLLAKLPMKMAVGTSLLIIAAKSLIGFLGDLSTQTIDWQMLLIFTALSIVGIFIGSALSKKINERVLKTGFGWFVLLMGIYIITKELLAV